MKKLKVAASSLAFFLLTSVNTSGVTNYLIKKLGYLKHGPDQSLVLQAREYCKDPNLSTTDLEITLAKNVYQANKPNFTFKSPDYSVFEKDVIDLEYQIVSGDTVLSIIRDRLLNTPSGYFDVDFCSLDFGDVDVRKLKSENQELYNKLTFMIQNLMIAYRNSNSELFSRIHSQLEGFLKEIPKEFLIDENEKFLTEAKVIMRPILESYYANYSKGRYELALGDLLKIKNLDVWCNELDKEMEKVSKKILRNSSKYSIAILPFKNYTQDPSLTGYYWSKLTNYIFTTKKGAVKVLEREQLDSLVEEGGQVRWVGSRSSMPDYVIVGSIAFFETTSENREIVRATQYKDATNKIPNPEYQSIKEEMDKIYMQYLAEKEKSQNASNSGLSSLGWGLITGDEDVLKRGVLELGVSSFLYSPEYYKQKYDELKRKLEKTPAYLDGVSNLEYREQEVIKEGAAELTFRIISLKTGSIIGAGNIEADIRFSDITRPGYPQANINPDPLEIPTNLEVKKALLAKSLLELGNKVSCTLNEAYLKKGMYYEGRGDSYNAYKNYMRYLVSAENDGCEINPEAEGFIYSYLVSH